MPEVLPDDLVGWRTVLGFFLRRRGETAEAPRMTILPLLGFGAFVTASLYVGARLLWLARRTRQVPELAIGLSLFAGGGIGYLLIMFSFGLHVLPPAWAPIGLIVGSFFTTFGACALVIGIARIFRAGEAWANRFARAICAVLAIAFAGRFLDPTAVPSPPWIFWTSTFASGVAYGWSAFESLRYAALLRRRVRVGLAEAALVRRFALWGMSGAAALGICVSGLVARLIAVEGVPPAQVLLDSSLGLVAAAGIWLAFFPPRRMRQEQARTDLA